MSYFDFKQFRVYHDKCAMKVGTDGVLLGAWAPVDGAHRILDVGAGSGLVSLMLAQRSGAHIVGVELDVAAAIQARANVEQSPFSNRIEIVQADITRYATESKFDLIVSNPPFFSNALISPDPQRSLARHTSSLSLHQFIHSASSLLRPDGLLSVILPTDVAKEFTNFCIVNHFTPIRRTDIRTVPHKAPKRALLTFIKGIYSAPLIVDELILTTSTGQRSDDYHQLTKDFYLDRPLS